MKVILLKDLKGTGKKNDVVEVADGYAKNYLIPNKIATATNANNLNENKQLKAAQDYHRQQELEKAIALGEKLKGMEVVVKIKNGENGKVFGSVTAKEISGELLKLGYDVDKKKIVLNSPLKNVGVYSVEAKLHTKVSVKFNVKVEAI